LTAVARGGSYRSGEKFSALERKLFQGNKKRGEGGGKRERESPLGWPNEPERGHIKGKEKEKKKFCSFRPLEGLQLKKRENLHRHATEKKRGPSAASCGKKKRGMLFPHLWKSVRKRKRGY